MSALSIAYLFANYESLARNEQAILRMLAHYRSAVTRYQFNNFCTGKIGTGGKSATHSAIDRTISFFVEKQLTTKGLDGFGANHLAIDFLIRHAADLGETREIIESISRFDHMWGWRQTERSYAVQFLTSFYAGDEESAVRSFDAVTIGSFPWLEPFDMDRFRAMTPKMKCLFARHTVARILGKFGRTKVDMNPTALAGFNHLLRHDLVPYVDTKLRQSVLEWALATGDRELLGILKEVTNGKAEDVFGCIALLDGDFEKAANHLVKTSGNATTKALTLNGRLPSLYYYLLKLSGRCGALPADFSKSIESGSRKSGGYADAFELLQFGLSYRNKTSPERAGRITDGIETRGPLARLASGYLSSWFQIQRPATAESLFQKVMVAQAEYFRAAGCHWLAMEADAMAGTDSSRSGSSGPDSSGSSAADFASLVNLLQPSPVWEQRLQSIIELVESTGNTNSATAAKASGNDRLIFEISFSDQSLQLDAFHQSQVRGKGWTKGRKISLKRLLESLTSNEFPFLTEQDRKVISSFRLQMIYGGYGTQEIVEIVSDRAVQGLIGHPLVFLRGEREQPIEIVDAPPRLIVEESGAKNVFLRLDPSPPSDSAKIYLRSPSAGKLVVTQFNPATLKLHQRLGNGLQLPRNESHRLPAVLRPLSSVVMVHSEVEMGDGGTSDPGGPSLAKAEVVAGLTTPYVHLFPSGGGYLLDIFVHPFGEAGPSCRPGEGGTKLFANVGGKSVTANRDLSAEVTAANQLLEQCANARSWLQSAWSAVMPTPLEALEVLLELDSPAREGRCHVLWPQGKAIRLAGQVGSSNLQVRIKKDRDWFAASGSLQIDSKLSLDMMQLIDKVAASPSRFIELDDGSFLALTDKLRRQVAEFAGFGDRRKADSMRFPAAHAGMFDHLSEVKIKADAHWQSMLERMRAAQELEPKKPAGFLAELRDYQEDGYKWMSRLAAWGVGGCLADDMGLGKTIQAIGLLLSRASGPALVIAPTSVVFNWAAEIQRFAPTLRPRMVAEEATADELTDLQPHDVVLCSYGLLQHRTAMVKATSWNTLILDEAQAIKNASTQRSQAAKSLTADFRLIMTGTPIENHLGELWNLMDFINPGLLGSAEAFQQRFATPIERDQCRQTKARLKKLVSPFLLRRTKAQVLTELPSRTEITLHVTLSPAEAAFYESLRQQAMEKLADVESENNSHLRILAEIMRLRRACCNPELLTGNNSIECSKLKLFLETIEELRAGGHKALVFSQFVDHLGILRRELDDRKVPYQYLDGSTPAKERKSRVEAFQAGEGDLFLISLKAGGAGLNLTAADYVLHMDPWWNPAVEDQASDRAHRMGQLRPVTIYRFITEGTIEQKIQQLHGSKRDLADSLLEGAERSGKMSADELLALLRG